MFNKSNLPKRCRRFESRFEDYLSETPGSGLDEHLAQCEECSAALKNSRVAGELLRGAWEPAREPGAAFLANVMARIQREKARLESHAAFWAPLEFLASRLSFTAAIVLLALSAYVVKFSPGRSAPSLVTQTELSASDMPQPPGDPVSNEEVLQSLAERSYGR